MTVHQFAWGAIALEILVFLVWLYKIWFPDSGADAAGRGLGVVYTLGLGIYILLGLGLMLFKSRWSSILAAVMALLPVLVTIYGVVHWLRNR